MSYKVVFTDYYYPNLDEERRVFEQANGDFEIVDCTKIAPGGIKDPAQLVEYVKDADAVVVQFAKITAEVIDAMQRCRVIARYAIGVDTIDLKAAAKKNIAVANVPDYCIEEVADTAIAHILNGMRKLTPARDLLLSGQFGMTCIRPMKRMEESTLCLLGFGHISRNVAAKCKPFFKKIVAYDPYFTAMNQYPDIEFTGLEAALRQADVVSVHVPLCSETRGMLSTEQFAQMKDGVVLVNTARGGIIDEQAMLDALNFGKVSHCGLDVLSTEEFASSPFLRHPRVCLTPHVGWCSEEAVRDLQQKTAQNVVSALLEGRPVYCVR